MATDSLKSQFPNDDFDNEVKIPGGSAKDNDNVGWADIVRWGKDKVEVWEVKQAGGPAEAADPAQLARYIKKLQKMQHRRLFASPVLRSPGLTHSARQRRTADTTDGNFGQ